VSTLACLLRPRDATLSMTTNLAAGPPVVLIAGAPQPSLASELGDHRYAIAQAQTGALAVEWARDLHPDAVLLAADFPDMPRIEVCRLLRADLRVGSNVPILFLCADEPSPAERVIALRAGAWGFMRFPGDAAQLALQLDAYLQAKRHVDSAFAQGLIDRATALHSPMGLVRRARELGALMTRTHGSLACIVFALETEHASAAIAHVVAQNTRTSDVVGTLEPTTVTVLAPATDRVGAAKLAERVGGTLRDPALRVGYDAVANLTYAPMDPVELLARARAAVRHGRSDPARAWLRCFDGARGAEGGIVLDGKGNDS
jgi:DNA-binding response OmpR family regulator